MFSHGRACLKRPALSGVLDNVTAGSEEPLLFLYPRWVASASASRHRTRRPLSSKSAASPTSRAPGSSSHGLSSRPPRRPSFGYSSRRWIWISENIPTVSNDTGVSPSHDGASTSPRGPGPSESTQEKKGGSSGYAKRGSPRSPPQAKSQRVKKPVFNAFSGIEEQASQGASTSGAVGAAAAGTKGSAQTKPVVVLKKLSVRDRRKLRCRVFLEKSWDRATKTRWSQWSRMRGILERLHQDSRMWDKKGVRTSKNKELLVPEETVALLAGVTSMSMKENIWYVRLHNGCKVHVLHPLESEGHRRKVILSGSDRVLELVGDRIAHVQKMQEQGDPLVDVRKPSVTVFPSTEALRRKGVSPPRIRGVWDLGLSRPVKLDNLLPILEEVSTVREFAEYVELLTKALPSYSGDTDTSHQKQVAMALMKLFRDEKKHSLISTAALNHALLYLCEHQYLVYSNAVYTRCEHVATVDTFNILLKSNAKKQDIRTFHRFLLSMSRMCIGPDENTWLAYLECIVSPKAKANVISYMLEKKYLSSTAAMRTAFQMTVQDEFLEHLESGRDVDSFIDMVARKEEINWFTTSLINQMFGVTVRLKDFAATRRLLEICKQNSFTFNSSTVTQIMQLFHTDIFSALHYLLRYFDRLESTLRKDAYERLFLIAFKGRHYNICRVLWRYACMYGGVSYKMRHSVLSSLTRNTSSRPGKDLDNIWRNSAGKVIIGIDLHLPNYPRQSEIQEIVPPAFRSNVISYLMSGYKPAGPDRDRQLNLANVLAKHDTEVGCWYRPSMPLAIMLEAAAAIDQEWKKAPRPTPWLLGNAIQVPVKKSDFPR